MKSKFKISLLFFFVLHLFFVNAQEKKDTLIMGNIGFYVEPAMSSGFGSPVLYPQYDPVYGYSGNITYSNPKPNVLATVYGFGMDITLLKRKRVSLKTGLSYKIFTYNGISDLKSFHYEPSNIGYAGPRTLVIDAECKSCHLFNYEAKFINIPLSVQYYFGIKKSHAFFIDAAIMGSLRVAYDTPTWYYTGETTDKYLFSSIGVGFNQRLGNTNLFIEPVFNYQITPAFGFRHYSVGLKTGATLNFSKPPKLIASTDTSENSIIPKREKIKNRFSLSATSGINNILDLSWLYIPGIDKRPGGFIRLTGNYRASRVVSFTSGITYRHFLLPAEYITPYYNIKQYSYERTVRMLMFPFWINFQSTLGKKLKADFYGGFEYSFVKVATTGENYSSWGWGIEYTKPINRELWFATAGLKITYDINSYIGIHVSAAAATQTPKLVLRYRYSPFSFMEYGLGMSYRFIRK